MCIRDSVSPWPSPSSSSSSSSPSPLLSSSSSSQPPSPRRAQKLAAIGVLSVHSAAERTPPELCGPM
eukprot:7044023-Alexandrium_andersonii.AAC.1